MDAGKVPPKQRNAYVSMAVRRAAPFADPEFGLAWAGDHASIWYWSRGRVLALLGGTWPKRIHCVPEALYTGTPAEADSDAQQLLALANGHEGRLWKQGRLVASRWWPQPPDAAGWAGFLRGAGFSGGDTALPTPLPAPIAARHWSLQRRSQANLSLAGVDAYLPRIALGVAAVFVLAMAFEAGAIVRSWIDIWQARNAAQTLDQPLKRILAARERADRDSAEASTLLSLRAVRTQTELLAELARLLPGNDWQLRRWEQPAGDRLTVTLLMPKASPEALVAAWEASPMFNEVTTDLSGKPNEITIKAHIVGHQRAAP